MGKWLRLPELTLPPTDLGEEVRTTLDRKEQKPQGEIEPIEILRMDPLTSWQVRKFAAGEPFARPPERKAIYASGLPKTDRPLPTQIAAG